MSFIMFPLLIRRVSAWAFGLFLLCWSTQSISAQGAEPVVNSWDKLVVGQIGPRTWPALSWSADRKSFLLVSGLVSHEHKGDKPYDVMSLDLQGKKWLNELPPGAMKRGNAEGAVADPGFKSPYFELMDKDGVARIHPHQAMIGDQFALAPWDGQIYALVCGRTLRFDPAKREWKDLQPEMSPTQPTRSYKETWNWGALVVDPVNKEIVLVGGCGLANDGAGPGTWVYSTEKNSWRDLGLKTQPSNRALSPMAYDPGAKKIVLFGGDSLDTVRADTWVYDCATRTWEERRPPVSPSPRFGHALLYLPKSGKVALIGGKAYTSPLSYAAMLYRVLPFEIWLYDVEKNSWNLLQHLEKDAPLQAPNQHLAAAVNDQDDVLLIAPQTAANNPAATWFAHLDTSKANESGTAKWGVKPGTIEQRTGPYDPAWYSEGIPHVDEHATAAILEKLIPNRWTPLICPKWPNNRMGGGWSTVTLDTDRDQILHLGGGHSSYFGNDVAIYDIKRGRWSISYRPQFALNYNYDLSGPGPWAFNNAPWGNHNYHAYAYDSTIQRLVFTRGPAYTLFYDPATKSWPVSERITTPYPAIKYTTYLCSTPNGLIAWAHTGEGVGRMGLYRLEKGKKWEPLKLMGGKLPASVTDGSTFVFDSRRDQVLMTTTPEKPSSEPAGQVWSCDLKSGTVKKLDPAGRDAIKVSRFAREAVYLPKNDLVLFGYALDGKTPFYDVVGNRWLTAEIPGYEFSVRKVQDGVHASVDLGLIYDAKRDLVWAVMCKLQNTGDLQVLRIDSKTLKLLPLAGD